MSESDIPTQSADRRARRDLSAGDRDLQHHADFLQRQPRDVCAIFSGNACTAAWLTVKPFKRVAGTPSCTLNAPSPRPVW